MRASARADARAVVAASRLGCLRTDRWHLVAAILLDDGFDGDALVALAALTSNADGWDVDPLAPDAIRELGEADLAVDAAGDVVAAVVAHVVPRTNYATVRYLARLAYGLDFPGGSIGQAYELEEYLDCDCHVGSRTEADLFESDLRARPLAVRPDLAALLV